MDDILSYLENIIQQILFTGKHHTSNQNALLKQCIIKWVLNDGNLDISRGKPQSCFLIKQRSKSLFLIEL